MATNRRSLAPIKRDVAETSTDFRTNGFDGPNGFARMDTETSRMAPIVEAKSKQFARGSVRSGRCNGDECTAGARTRGRRKSEFGRTVGFPFSGEATRRLHAAKSS